MGVGPHPWMTRPISCTRSDQNFYQALSRNPFKTDSDILKRMLDLYALLRQRWIRIFLVYVPIFILCLFQDWWV